MILDEMPKLYPPGRFLKQDSITKIWYVISHNDAMKKLKQSFTDILKALKTDNIKSYDSNSRSSSVSVSKKTVMDHSDNRKHAQEQGDNSYSEVADDSSMKDRKKMKLNRQPKTITKSCTSDSENPTKPEKHECSQENKISETDALPENHSVVMSHSHKSLHFFIIFRKIQMMLLPWDQIGHCSQQI